MLALLVTGLFYLIIFATGWAIAKRSGDGDSAEGLLLGGRKIPLWIGMFTMTATWVGGGYINGTSEAVFASGLIWTQAPWGYALSLIVGGLFFARRMRAAGYTTMLDPFQKHYGRRVTAWLFIPAMVGEIFWSAAILTALGATFGTILDISFTTSVVVSAAVAIAYTYMGGMWSVALTDVVQLVLIMVGLGLAVPFAIEAAGGWDVVWQNYQQRFGHDAQFLPPASAFTSSGWQHNIWVWGDYALLLICGGVPWGVYFQRVLAARNARTAQNLSYVAALGCLLAAVPAVLIGMAASSADWSTTALGTAPDAFTVLPMTLKYLTPEALSVVGLAAVAAAVMSSMDSSILSVSTMFTWNIVRPLKGELSPAATVKTTKITIIVMGLLTTLLALQVGSVYDLWFFCADLVYVILFPQLVLVLFSRHHYAQAAMAGLLVGGALRFSGGFDFLGLSPAGFWPVDSSGAVAVPMRTFSMLTSLAVTYFTARLLAARGVPSTVQSEKELAHDFR